MSIFEEHSPQSSNSKAGNFFKKLKLWKVARVVFALIVLAIGLLSWCFFFSKALPGMSNLEKFCSINVDLAAAGFNEKALQEKLKADPEACRVAVDHHKRKRFIMVDNKQEKAITSQFVSQMEQLNILYNDAAVYERCRAILKRLHKVMPEGFSPPEKFYIVDTPAINACCLPDGTVILFRGLIEAFDDDQLAFVIGHELAHGAARHTSEMISKSVIQKLSIEIFNNNASNSINIDDAKIVALFANLKYSRVQEFEADRLGALYIYKAKFDVNAALRVLQSFARASRSDGLLEKLLSTHPAPEDRVRNMQSVIADLKENPDPLWGSEVDDKLNEATDKALQLYKLQKLGKKFVDIRLPEKVNIFRKK